jgi:hypothetical protein
LGESGEERTLNQLEEALRNAREAPGTAVARIQALMARDIADLVPTLERIAAERLMTVSAQLVQRGEEEARSLSELLEQQRSRIFRQASTRKAPEPIAGSQILRASTCSGVASSPRRSKAGSSAYFTIGAVKLRGV